MKLHGIHHVTAITARARENHHFYTQVLGMRLVKKTVNQDDVSAYHLFYADGNGTPGSDLTFFDWPAAPEQRGTPGITRTGLRIGNNASLEWWHDRLRARDVRHEGIAERDGRAVLDFEDPEGQRLCFVADEADGKAHPWTRSPVPPEHQIRGLGPVTLSVPKLERTDRVFRELLNMQPVRSYDHAGREARVYQSGDASGPAQELHVMTEPGAPFARQGAGGVHHLALRTTLSDYDAWAARLSDAGIPHSGPVNRFWFRSLYFREPNGILIEIATDEPGFTADEPSDRLGEALSLPPFLEPRRAEIEAGLKPL
ncbi:MAG: ring-cleaving dioxygenase [Chthoniobacterales bacterium]|nr:ring-cleaving dioxygenase [Chthoniobacterales bacterium]